MSDTSPRGQVCAPRMLADALLRGVGGTEARLRVTGSNTDSNQAEVGLIATSFSEIVVSPVAMRKLRPSTRAGDANQWEMLVSATSIQAQLNALDLASAQALFAMTLGITVAGTDYLIESVAVNEFLGTVYLYRLTLREVFRHSL